MEASEPGRGRPFTGALSLPLKGFEVLHVTFGYLVDIVAYGEAGGRSESGALTPAPSAQIRFESAFDLIDPANDALHLDPSKQEWEDLTPVLSLRHDRIDSAQATDAGRLSIQFTSGRTLRAGPDPNYENWAVTGPGFELIATPGGGMVLFGQLDG